MLEVITGIIGFVFRDTLSDRSGDEYRQRLNETITLYRRNQDAPDYDESRNNAIDSLQNTVSQSITHKHSLLIANVIIA